MPVRQKNDTARLYGTFTDIDGTALDATIARLNTRSPAGTVASATYPGTVVRDSTGSYHYDLAFTLAGDWQWWWEFELSGSIAATTETELERVQEIPD